VNLEVTRAGAALKVGHDHPDQASGLLSLAETMGTAELEVVLGLMRQLVNATTPGATTDVSDANFALAVMRGLQPQNEAETMLITQMVTVHLAVVAAARRLAHVETLPQLEVNERAFNRLARTYAAQAEALHKLRSRGKQEITVVHVERSAVGGDVHIHAGGGAGENQGQPLTKVVDHAGSPQLPPLRGSDAEGRPLPGPGRRRAETLPDARRGEPWRTEG
jgi:hypothetical protein